MANNFNNWLADLFGLGTPQNVTDWDWDETRADDFGVGDSTGTFGATPDDPSTMTEAEFAQYIKDTWGPDFWDELLSGIETDVNTDLGLGEGQPAGWYAGQAEDYAAGYQTPTDWMTEQGYTFGTTETEQAAMQDLIDLLSDPTAAWGTDAGQYTATTLGFGTEEEYNAAKAAMNERLQGTNALENYEGMSEADKALRERQNRSNLREMEDRAKRIVQNTMADTGSTARMLATADEAARSINNAQIQQDVALAQEDYERQLTNMQQEMAMYDRYVQTGQMAYNDYLNMRSSAANAALGGYMSKISAINAQNEQYLGQYNADQQAIERHINTMLGLADYWGGLEMTAQNLIDQRYAAVRQQVTDSIQSMITAYELDTTVLMTFLEAGSMIADIVSVLVGL